jgi:hypothetical protein
VAILSHRFRPAMTFFDIDNRSVRSHHIERSLPFLLEFPVQRGRANAKFFRGFGAITA